MNFWSGVFQDVEHGRLLSFRRRWNEVAYLFGPKLISNVKHTETCIIISYKDNILALKGAGPVLVDIVGTETQTSLAEVAFRHRASAHDHWILFFADIDHPD